MRDPRPICQECGKRLTRLILTWHCVVHKAVPRPEVGKESPWGRVECIFPPRGKEDPERRIRFWTGLYGLEGESRFCSKRCAVNWAQKKAPIVFDGSSGTVPDGWDYP